MNRSDEQSPAGAGMVPTYETGVFLALNALENALLVMNAPRCPFVRGLKVFLHNDLNSTVYRSTGRHRLITSEWMGYEDVVGDEGPFQAMLTGLVSQVEHSWVLTFQNISSFVSGFDLTGLSAQAGQSGKSVVLPLDGPRLDLDFLDGYDQVLGKVMSRLLASPGRETELLLAGHGFWRNEADEVANVNEMRRLLAELGVADPIILLSGGRLDTDPISPKHVALMPHGGQRSKAALADANLDHSDLEIPLGIKGTTGWIRAMGSLLGMVESADDLIERELSELIPHIQSAVTEHLLGRKAAVVGDLHLGGALVSFLRELGLKVEGFFCLSNHEPEIADCTILQNPSAEDFTGFLQSRPVDLVIGSGVFKYLNGPKNTPYLEIGFPSYFNHVLHPRPYLGFRGARCLIESIFNALLVRDERENALQV